MLRQGHKYCDGFLFSSAILSFSSFLVVLEKLEQNCWIKSAVSEGEIGCEVTKWKLILTVVQCPGVRNYVEVLPCDDPVLVFSV